jgi:hypothetical protein
VNVTGKGRYLGRHGSAGAVGTVWAASEPCDATVFTVKSGKIISKVRKGSVGVKRTESRVVWGRKGRFRKVGGFRSTTVVG